MTEADLMLGNNMTQTDLLIGLAFLVIIVGVTIYAKLTKPKSICPECGGNNMHIHKEEPTGMFAAGQSNTGGGRATATVVYNASVRCLDCDHVYRKQITDTN